MNENYIEFEGELGFMKLNTIILPIKLKIKQHNSLNFNTNKVTALKILESCSDFTMIENFIIVGDHSGIKSAIKLPSGRYSCYISNRFSAIRKL